jgi:hypothetical protein
MSSSSLRELVPVKTHFDRDKITVGEYAFDTVAQCGGDASGQYCKTLTGTDVYFGWIEERSLLNSANKWTQEAITDIRDGLPYPMKGGHWDNGPEFMNKPLIAWCTENHIDMSRGRPYHSNDNCFAEQKNFDAVRKTVGYFRFDTLEEQAALAEVYKYLCPLNNYWWASFRLVSKEQQANGKWKKVYEKAPISPYQRLLEYDGLAEEYKAELRRRKAEQNPVELMRKLNAAVDRLLTINRRKYQTVADAAGQNEKMAA